MWVQRSRLHLRPAAWRENAHAHRRSRCSRTLQRWWGATCAAGSAGKRMDSVRLHEGQNQSRREPGWGHVEVPACPSAWAPFCRRPEPHLVTPVVRRARDFDWGPGTGDPRGT